MNDHRKSSGLAANRDRTLFRRISEEEEVLPGRLLPALALALLLLAVLAPSAFAGDAYVVNSATRSASVSVINAKTNKIEGPPIKIGGRPDAIAMAPNGRKAYVVNGAPGNVSVINTLTNQVVGPPIRVGGEPTAIAIIPHRRR